MKRIHFAICVKKKNVPITEACLEQEIESPIETALNAIKEIQKVHPNAEISIEVEM